jgi:hypothetical protein
MAKADSTTSTSDWIWLWDALQLAFTVLGSKAGAKEQLTEWLAARKLPWDCTRWEALDDAGIAELRRGLRKALMLAPIPSAAYYRGDPRFWGASCLKIDWADNAACEEVMGGARAWGIKVPRARLLELLPGRIREDESEQLHGAGVWIAAEARRMKKDGEIPPGILISKFARELAKRMTKAATGNRSLRPITAKSIENGLRGWGLWPVTSIK